MTARISLDVDFDREDGTDDAKEFARIVVANAYGHTRDGRRVSITIDCGKYTTLQAEVDRLKDELDAALQQARQRFREHQPASATEESKDGRPTSDGAGQENPDLAVSEIMSTELLSVRPNDTLDSVERLMNSGIRHVLVRDDQGHLVGVVSRRDVLFNKLLRTLGHGRHMYDTLLERVPVKQIMQGDVVSVLPQDTISIAAGLMRERKVSCLPVVQGQDVLGIVTSDDLLARMTGSGSVEDDLAT